MHNYLNTASHHYKQRISQPSLTRPTRLNLLKQQLAFIIFLVLSLLVPVSELIAQGSIPCDGSLYFTRQLSSSTRISSVNVNAAGTVTVVDKVTLNPNILTNATVYYNGYVFTQDWNPATFTLTRVANYNGTNNYTSKTVTGIPNNVDFNNAGVDKNGIMYLLSTDANPIIYKIDLKNWSTNGNGTLSATSATCTMTAGTRLWGDIAIDPLTNKAYVWYHPSTNPPTGQAVRGLYEIQNITSANPSIVKVGSAADYTMGTLFFNERGQLFSYGISTATAGNQVNFYYIDKSNSSVTQIGTSESSPQSDGCECAYRLSLTLTTDNAGNVNIANCSKPSDFNIQLAASNTAVGEFSGVTFTFPLDPRFSFAESGSAIETYLKSIFGPQVVVALSSNAGGTNNVLNASGLSVPGTSTNSGSPVNLPFAIKVTVASGGNDFTDGEKVDFQANFGGLTAFYGNTEQSGDPNSLFGKIASTITFTKTNSLCNTLSGNVLHDINGLTDQVVNGPNVNTNLGLKALLVDASGKIAAFSTVNTTTGSYTFPIGPGTYSVILTTSNATASNIGGQASDIVVQAPATWLFTGENLGVTTGNDGVQNGILTNIVVTDTDVENANFGIQQPPLATTSAYILNSTPKSGTSIPLNGTVAASAGSGALVSNPAGSDPDANGKVVEGFIITSLPVSSGGTEVGGSPKLYYNNVEVTTSDVTGAKLFKDPTLFRVELNGTGYQTASFDFKTKDAAGALSSDATYSLIWSSPLPVTLISFNAYLQDNNIIRLSWKTASEINASHFDLERSVDTKQWTQIKQVTAVGNTKTSAEYIEYDRQPMWGRNYYRLKMIDQDGSFAYSRIISLLDGQNDVAIYPNPGANRLFVKDIDFSSVTAVSVINTNGQVVFQSKTLTEQGIDLSNFANGIYSVEIRKNTGATLIRKLVVNR